MSEPEEFSVDKEDWSSVYTIKTGIWKGYRVMTKVVMQRIIPKEEIDKDDMPVFKLAYKVVTSTLRPKS